MVHILKSESRRRGTRKVYGLYIKPFVLLSIVIVSLSIWMYPYLTESRSEDRGLQYGPYYYPDASIDYTLNETYLPQYRNSTGNFGDANSSIAVIGSGIDFTHIKFGNNSYGDADFGKKIVGWYDPVDGNVQPVDGFGSGTAAAALACAVNDTGNLPSTSPDGRMSLTLGGRYHHPTLFENWVEAGRFSLYLGSFYVYTPNSNITVNATYSESTSYISDVNITLYTPGGTPAVTVSVSGGTYVNFDYNVTDVVGLYYITFDYSVGVASPALFSVAVNVLFAYPVYSGTYGVSSALSGAVPACRLVGIRTLDNSGSGNAGLIGTALQWLDTNYAKYRTVAAVVTPGNYTGTVNLTDVVNSLLSSGVMVIFAAGDGGITGGIPDYAGIPGALIVGAAASDGRVASYSASGSGNGGFVPGKAPDIIAFGGSSVTGKRGLIVPDVNGNDGGGSFADMHKNDTAFAFGTSLSASLAAAAYDMMVKAYGGYAKYSQSASRGLVMAFKSYMLMTAAETGLPREEDPLTSYSESSAANSPVLGRGSPDIHEGYGLLEIPAAVDAISNYITPDTEVNGTISAVKESPFAPHVFARRITLKGNSVYRFNLTFDGAPSSDLDLYVYYNVSTEYGYPLLWASSTTEGHSSEFILKGVDNITRDFIVVVKAVSGRNVNFTLNITEMPNIWAPSLHNASVYGENGYNDTLDTFVFRVNYTDRDNIPPVRIWVSIGGFSENISLEKADPTDNNYTDGVIYIKRLRLYYPGNYSCVFGVFDGNNMTLYNNGTPILLHVILPENSVFGNYRSDFSNLSGWRLNIGAPSSGWNNLTVTSSEDTGVFYPNGTGNRVFMYFGNAEKAREADYTYNGLPAGTYKLESPLFFINGSSPTAFMCYRVSINTGDSFSVALEVNRSGNPITLTSISAAERDWNIAETDLSGYNGSYIRFIFTVTTDGINDNIRYKGVMISEIGVIMNASVPSEGDITVPYVNITPYYGPYYGKFTFKAVIGYNGTSVLPPYEVILEVNGINFTAVNLYGISDPSLILTGSGNFSGGIYYVANVTLPPFSESLYRFHIRIGDDWFVTDYRSGPLWAGNMSDEITVDNYPFRATGDNMAVYGTPSPLTVTYWASYYTGFHYIPTDGVWYAGNGKYAGYGLNWNVSLITPAIRIPTFNEEPEEIYLIFSQRLIFDTNYPGYFNDYAYISVSTDLGKTWSVVTEYRSAISNFDRTTVSLEDYRGLTVMFAFVFITDGTGAPSANAGWSLTDISVGIDPLKDRIPPVVIFEDITNGQIISGNFTFTISITDNVGIDPTRIAVYFGSRAVKNIHLTDDGKFTFWVYTLDYPDGNYTLTVVAYDTSGNRVIASITVTVRNPHFPIWLVIGIIAAVSITVGITIYTVMRRRAELDRWADVVLMQKLEEGHDPPLLTLEERKGFTAEQIAAYERALARYREDLIRREAEEATPESEAAKPFMLYCKKCRKWFLNYRYEWICPICGRDSLKTVYKCKLCGKWYFFDEPSEIGTDKEHMCKKCGIRLLKPPYD